MQEAATDDTREGLRERLPRILSELDLRLRELRTWLLDEPRAGELHPGEAAPASGQYLILDTLGHSTGMERTVVQGKPLPPTPEPGQVYRLVDPTRNAAGVPATH